MVTGQDIVASAYKLLGASYRTWYYGASIPMWLDDNAGDPPPLAHLQYWGVMCFPGDTEVLAEGVEKSYRRVYSGELVTIKTASGKELSGTPNHPVLTDRGWVALKDLAKGDNVICDTLCETNTGSKPHDQREPVAIQEIHDALASPGSTKRVASTTNDFHGDGEEGYVDVVYPYGLLRNRIKASFFKHLDKLRFATAYARKLALAREGAVDPVGFVSRTPHGFVSRVRKSLSLLSGHSAISQPASLRVASTGAALLEPPVDNDLGESHCSSDLTLSFAEIDVSPDNFVSIHVEPVVGSLSQPGGFRHSAALDTSIVESPTDGPIRNAEPFGDGLCGFPADVRMDYVIDIKRNMYVGHVYNLQTQSGQYIANGIVTHNCSDLVNWALEDNGLPAGGGTLGFADYLIGVSDFDSTMPGVPGAIALSPYQSPVVGQQGHIAIYVDEHTLIQALHTPGITDQFTDVETYNWGGDTAFTTYGFLPGVNYQDIAPEPVRPEPYNWFGIGSDNVVRLGGDYSNGWIGTDKDGWLRRVQ